MNNEILYEAYLNWRKGLKKFYWFLVSTPFASIENLDEFSIVKDVKQKEESLSVFNNYKEKFKCISNNELILIDLDGEESLDLALSLNNAFNIKPVIVFAQVYHPKGIVGNSTVLSKLIQYSFELNSLEGNIYSFVFDYSRNNNEGFDKRKFYNNQYELTEEELPLREDLYNNGINSVTILTYKEIKEDMQGYIEYLNECNIKVDVIQV